MDLLRNNVSLFHGPQSGEVKLAMKRLKILVKTDTHSPGMYSAYVPLAKRGFFL
jgi:hypothetical protein